MLGGGVQTVPSWTLLGASAFHLAQLGSEFILMKGSDSDNYVILETLVWAPLFSNSSGS